MNLTEDYACCSTTDDAERTGPILVAVAYQEHANDRQYFTK